MPVTGTLQLRSVWDFCGCPVRTRLGEGHTRGQCNAQDTQRPPHQQLMDKGNEMARLPKEQRARQWERPRPLPGEKAGDCGQSMKFSRGTRGRAERAEGLPGGDACVGRCQFRRPAVTNYPKLEGLKQQMYHLTALEARVRDQGVSQATLPVETAGENLFLPLPASGGPRHC